MFVLLLILIMTISTACLFVVPWTDEEMHGGTITRDQFGRIISTQDANGRAILNEVYYADDLDTLPTFITALSCVHLIRVSGDRYVRVYLDGISLREATDVHLDQASGDFTWTSEFLDIETLRLNRKRMTWGIEICEETLLAVEGKRVWLNRATMDQATREIVVSQMRSRQSLSSATSCTKEFAPSRDIKLAS